MTNVTLSITYAAMALVSVLLFILSWKKETQDALDTSFRCMLLTLLGWESMLFLQCLALSPALIRYFYDLKLPFVAFSAAAWFFYIIRFYGLDSYFPFAVRVSVMIIPVFTTILSLCSPLHPYLRESVEIVVMQPLQKIEAVRGPWFWYHTAYCYGLVLLCIIVALAQHRKIARIHHMSSVSLLFGLGLTVAGNLFVLSDKVDVDLSLAALGLASVVLFFVNRNTQGKEFFQHARQEVYNYVSDGIFLLDKQGNIVNANQSGRSFLRMLALPEETQDFHQIAGCLEEKALQKNILHDDNAGVDYYLSAKTVYNLREKAMLDNDGGDIGKMMVVSNVSENREVIDYLESATGMDPLTGLANRRAFEHTMERLDALENLPLSILYGDLNNLKHTNDTLGHPQGDIYIRLAAETLKYSCPPNASIARIGGDEFVMLLPGYNAKKRNKLASDIEKAFAALKGYPFIPSISLGGATKEDMAQDIRALIQTADEAMYANKKRYKGQ